MSRETNSKVLLAPSRGRRAGGDGLLKEQVEFLHWHPRAGRPTGDREDTRMGPISVEQPHGPRSHPRRDSPAMNLRSPSLSGAQTRLAQHPRMQARGESSTPALATAVSHGAGQDMAPFYRKTFNLRCSPILYAQDLSDIPVLSQVLILGTGRPCAWGTCNIRASRSVQQSCIPSDYLYLGMGKKAPLNFLQAYMFKNTV